MANGRSLESSALPDVGKELSVDISSWVASINLHAQEGFLEALCVAQERSGYTVEDAARRIGTSVEAITEALTGETDLSLTEIRHLAIALDAIVEFRVSSARETWESNQTQKLASAMTEGAWRELPLEDLSYQPNG